MAGFLDGVAGGCALQRWAPSGSLEMESHGSLMNGRKYMGNWGEVTLLIGVRKSIYNDRLGAHLVPLKTDTFHMFQVNTLETPKVEGCTGGSIMIAKINPIQSYSLSGTRLNLTLRHECKLGTGGSCIIICLSP